MADEMRIGDMDTDDDGLTTSEELAINPEPDTRVAQRPADRFEVEMGQDPLHPTHVGWGGVGSSD